MKFISLFSGIGGFDLGFERAGMTCVAQVEFDKRAREVLRKHWPDVAIHEDVRNVGKQNLPIVDLVCGGFPCQDLSVAGKRKGLDGERSGLWFEFYRIIGELKPRWVVIENVPGLLTSNRGRDFAVILNGLVKCGYRVSWRVLDAQYFGVPQRRERVFIVGSLGNGRSINALFERPQHSSVECGSSEASKIISNCINAFDHSGSRAQNGTTFIEDARGIRRLTPLETERLQGFPDNWTAGQPDSARYKQCGNAVAVPVIEWIGKRIITADDAETRVA